jgi:hypothetical protein
MQILSLAGFLLTLALIGSMVYLFVEMFALLSSAFGETPSPFPWPIFIHQLPLLLLVVLPFLFLVVWYGVYIIAMRRAHLIFEDKTLVFESINRLNFFLQRGLKPFALPYDQIKNVKFSSLAAKVELMDFKGKKTVIFPALFGKNYGEEVLIELRSNLPVEAFESGIEISDVLQKWSRGKKAITIFAVFYLVVYLSTYFFDPMLSSRSWLTNAWQVELNPSGYQNVWTYSIDSRNNFWVVFWKSDGYRVYHFSDTVENKWRLPQNLLKKHYPQLVSEDKTGNPIIWLEDHVLHYDNGSWKAILYNNNLDLGDWNWRGIVSGEQGWAIEEQGQNKYLLKINALTGKWSVIPFPETANQQKLSPQSMQRTTNGDALVLMQGNTSSRVYLLSEDKWKLQEYPIILSDNSRIQDYFLDSNDSLWVLFETQDNFIVEKIDSAGKLHLTQLPSPKETDGRERYQYLIVDSSERLWAGGGYPEFLAVFTPVWKAEATQIVRYTDNNSNYQGNISTYPVILPNGQIWSFGRRISTIDTNLVTLPSPLPAWFASWDWNLIRLFTILLQLLLLIFIYIFPFRRVSPKK